MGLFTRKEVEEVKKVEDNSDFDFSALWQEPSSGGFMAMIPFANLFAEVLIIILLIVVLWRM